MIKLALLFPTLPALAIQKTRMLANNIKYITALQTMRTHKQIDTLIKKLIKAIKEHNIEVAQALLNQNHYYLANLTDPSTGHSLALTAINTSNSDIMCLLHRYGARLFEYEYKLCSESIKEEYPLFFRKQPFIGDLVPESISLT